MGNFCKSTSCDCDMGCFDRQYTQVNAPSGTYRLAKYYEIPVYMSYKQQVDKEYGELLIPRKPSDMDLMVSKLPAYIDGQNIFYEGEWLYREKHGIGIQIWPEKGVYEGEWQNGKPNGFGRIANLTGQSYTGQWREAHWHGQGKFINKTSNSSELRLTDTLGRLNLSGLIRIMSYQGGWIDTQPHGTGVLQSSQGYTYRGDFANGFMHGKGEMMFEDGSNYKGQFKNNNFEGQGVYRSPEGTYVGDWKNDMKHGIGIFNFPDGRKYEGWYVNDLKEGYGVFTWPTGRKYEGYWKAGKQHGQGIYTDKRGVRTKSLWVDGVSTDSSEAGFDGF